MKEFPPETKFRYTWRPYQARVLSELEEYLGDNRLHVVAAPGSGKTLLGLEVVRRLNQPSIILAPTLAIRDQWVSRLVDFFMPECNETPDWISTDIYHPRFLTVSTYQGLYSACSGVLENDDDLDLEEIESEDEDLFYNEDSENDEQELNEDNITRLLQELSVKTVVLDEAHHLRSNWWRCLTRVVHGLKESTVLALTATPPYDVSMFEWERYMKLCGPIDAEVSVPELVQEGNLCPHQDLVLFTYPSLIEGNKLKEFKQAVDEFAEDLESDEEFLKEVKNHPWLNNPETFVIEILDDPSFFSSMLVYLKHRKVILPKQAIELVAGEQFGIPWFNKEWLETLLEGMLFPPDVDPKDLSPVLKRIRDRLYRIDALERRDVNLRSTRKLDAVLKRSITKLYAVQAIVSMELRALGENLRMVILTDYIRKAYLPKSEHDLPKLDKIGVVPIFEEIRRSNLSDIKLGVLSGSLIVVPTESTELLLECADDCEILRESVSVKPIADPRFSMVTIKGIDSQKAVQLITELFSRGGVTVLVGTKSLLGEGWDAPSINSLVLASLVGSYMLSNQMRGRAIRTDPEQPDKISNIWHLVCVDLDSESAGNDYRIMERRFKAFLGISFVESVIENGFGRLGVGVPPFDKDEVREINSSMTARAKDRTALQLAWETSLKRGEEGIRLVEEVKAKKARLPVPRGFVFRNTISALAWEVLFLFGFFAARQIFSWVLPIGNLGLSFLSFLPILGFLYFILRFAPKALKAIWLFIMHGPIKSSLAQVGKAVLATLCEVGIVRTSFNDMRVVVEEGKKGEVFCHVEGGTRRERATYLSSLREVLGPVGSPRYLLLRKSMLGTSFVRQDYHAVPTVLGIKKVYAESFASQWKKYVGEMDLIYTRNKEGRIVLLRARNHSLSAGFRPRSERISRWK
ncbi:MAG: DEAD/DEAH box helicase family protein [Candidatus Thorarchaeota archaeon]